MKKGLVFLVCCLGLVVGKAQTQAPFIQWSKCYGGINDEEAYDIVQTSDSGYVVVGSTNSGDGDVMGYQALLDAWAIKIDKYGNIEWQKCLGGNEVEKFTSVIALENGNILISGFTASDNGNVVGHHGYAGVFDVWLVMLDRQGNLMWQKCLGGTSDDYGNSVKGTRDDGFIITGITASNNGDVNGNHGNNGTNAGFDVWVVKTDSIGNIQWQKCLGGINNESGEDIIETASGDFIIAANADSNGGDVSGNHGGGDWWIVKIDTIGNIKWQKCMGGTDGELVAALCTSSDGGYVITGQSMSHDGDVQGNHKDSTFTYFFEDFLTIKLDSSGNKVWQKCYGGNYDEHAYDIIENRDGNYIMAGDEFSYDGDVIDNTHTSSANYWIVCADSIGNIIWQKSMGGFNGDFANALIQSYDGGYVVAGRSSSCDGDVVGCHGQLKDFWVVKLSFDSTVLNVLQPDFNPRIIVSPNPATNQLNITIDERLVGAQLNLYNLTGALVQTAVLQIQNSKLQIQNLPSGVYIAEIKTKETSVKKRWVKM